MPSTDESFQKSSFRGSCGGRLLVIGRPAWVGSRCRCILQDCLNCFKSSMLVFAAFQTLYAHTVTERSEDVLAEQNDSQVVETALRASWLPGADWR